MTRALIDAEFHDTPIGRCVVLPKMDYQCPRCRASFSLPLGMTCDDHQPIQNYPSAGDVLAVVETCGGCNGHGYIGDLTEFGTVVPLTACESQDCDGYVRRGFVRVVEVLPVLAASHADGFNGPHMCIQPGGRVTVHRGGKWVDAELPLSPGDVVLVTEAWCETCDGVGGSWGRDGPHDRWDSCPDCAPCPVRVIHRDGVLGEVET